MASGFANSQEYQHCKGKKAAVFRCSVAETAEKVEKWYKMCWEGREQTLGAAALAEGDDSHEDLGHIWHISLF